MKFQTLLPILSLSLSFPLMACSSGTGPASDGYESQGTSVAANGLLRTHDCNGGAGYALSTHDSPELQPGLHVIGIYTADFSPPYWADPDCAAALDQCAETDCSGFPDACDVEPALSEGSVLVDIPGTNSLVLTAYEPTHWTVEVADGSTLEKVFLSGNQEQTVDVPEGTEIVQHNSPEYVYEWLTADDLSISCDEGQVDGGDEFCDAFGDAWHRERVEIAASRDRLLQWAEPLAGMSVASFTGCYNMSAISLQAEATD